MHLLVRTTKLSLADFWDKNGLDARHPNKKRRGGLVSIEALFMRDNEADELLLSQ